MKTGKDLIALGYKPNGKFKSALEHINANNLNDSEIVIYMDSIQDAHIPLHEKPVEYFRNIRKVLVCGKCCDVCSHVKIAELEQGEWWESATGDDLNFKPTHWMALPLPPAEYQYTTVNYKNMKTKKSFIQFLFSGFQNSFFTICVPAFSLWWSYHCIFDKPITTEGTWFGAIFAPVVIVIYFLGMFRNWKGKSM